MDTLRWIILGVGVALAVVIYLMSRSQRPKHRAPLPDEALEDVDVIDVGLNTREEDLEISIEELDAELRQITGWVREESDEHKRTEPAAADGGNDTPKEKPSARTRPRAGKASPAEREMPELFIILHVAARGTRRLSGQELLDGFEAVGLYFGEMDIFHCYSEVNGAQRQLFSVANMIKPGTLIPGEMAELQTPGVSFFMRLPGPLRPMEAFDEMLDRARRLAAALDAQVLAENRVPLTQQLTEHMRDRVRNFSLEMERARA